MSRSEERGIHRTRLGRDHATAIACTFKALADPTRVRLIAAIADGEQCVHDLCVALDLEQSTVSHQLRFMRHQGLVRHRREGRHVYYTLDDKHVKELFAMAREHVQHAHQRRAS